MWFSDKNQMDYDNIELFAGLAYTLGLKGEEKSISQLEKECWTIIFGYLFWILNSYS